MGDKQNTIKKLQGSARLVKFADKLDFEQVTNGSAKEYLKLYQYLFCEYNPVITADVTGKHQAELAGKEDKPFMECIYRLIRDMFDYVPKLTRDQFFSNSYAQVKAQMAIDIIDLVQKKIKTPPTAGSSSSSSSSSSASAASSNSASSNAQSGAKDSQLNTSANGPSSHSSHGTAATKTSKASVAKSEASSENGSSKPASQHHLPPKASRTIINGGNNNAELCSKLEGLMSRIELVEKYCQEISREKPQSKDLRTFKDEDEGIANGDEVQSNASDKLDDLAKSYEFQAVREEVEKLTDRMAKMESMLFSFEQKQATFDKKFDEFMTKQEEKKSLRRNSFSKFELKTTTGGQPEIISPAEEPCFN